MIILNGRNRYATVRIFKLIYFIFNFLFHNPHDKFERQIIVSNQTTQIESWRKHRCCAWVWIRVCRHQGSNSQPSAWYSIPMIRAKCDTTQLFRRPLAIVRYLLGIEALQLWVSYSWQMYKLECTNVAINNYGWCWCSQQQGILKGLLKLGLDSFATCDGQLCYCIANIDTLFVAGPLDFCTRLWVV